VQGGGAMPNVRVTAALHLPTRAMPATQLSEISRQDQQDNQGVIKILLILSMQ